MPKDAIKWFEDNSWQFDQPANRRLMMVAISNTVRAVSICMNGFLALALISYVNGERFKWYVGNSHRLLVVAFIAVNVYLLFAMFKAKRVRNRKQKGY